MAHSRRQFLNTAGAAAVYKVVNSGFALKAATANDQIGLGFIGSGVRGTFLLQTFKEIPGVRPVIVADLYDGYLERAKEQTGGVIATTKDYEKVIQHKDVDAVVIATPDHWHKKMVLDALEAGKHVYVEKPMTWGVKEGLEIRSAVEKSGKTLQVGSQHKTSALTAKARELVASGVLGKVTMVRMAHHRNDAQGAWTWPIPPDASPKTVAWERFLGTAPRRPYNAERFFRWRCWWDYSGGLATDLMVHQLTWLHYLMDAKAPKSAASQGGIHVWHDGRDVPDVLNTLYEYDEGFVADLYVHQAVGYPAPPTLILGSEGALEMVANWRGNEIILHPFTRPPDVQVYGIKGWPKRLRERYFLERGYTADGEPMKPPPPPRKPKEITVESRPSHYELFILSLREGKPSEENAAEGHYAAGAGHLANISYRSRSRVEWNPNTGEVWESR